MRRRHPVLVLLVLLSAGAITAQAAGRLVPWYEKKTLAQWMADVAGGEGNVKHTAINAMEAMGEKAAPAVDLLRKHLTDRDCRINVLRALAAIGPAAKPAVGDIRRVMATWHLSGQLYAHYALYALGEPAERHLAPILKAVDSADERTRRAAIIVLKYVGPDAAPATATLVTYLRSRTRLYNVLEALKAIGPPAKAAVGDLIKLLDDKKACRSVIPVLGAVGAGEPRAIEAMVRLARHGAEHVADEFDRQAIPADAVAALGRMGESALPALAKLIKDRDPQIAQRALHALRHIGPAAGALLVRALYDDRIGDYAVHAIAKRDDPPVRGILTALRSPVAAGRAMKVFRHMKAPPDAAIPTLVGLAAKGSRVLAGRDRNERESFIRDCRAALGHKGGGANAAALYLCIANGRSYYDLGSISEISVAGRMNMRAGAQYLDKHPPGTMEKLLRWAPTVGPRGGRFILLTFGRPVALEKLAQGAGVAVDEMVPCKKAHGLKATQWGRAAWLDIGVDDAKTILCIKIDVTAMKKWHTDMRKAAIAKPPKLAVPRPKPKPATPKPAANPAAEKLALARNYLAAGMTEKAKVLLKQVIQTAPSSPEAAEARRLLAPIP